MPPRSVVFVGLLAVATLVSGAGRTSAVGPGPCDVTLPAPTTDQRARPGAQGFNYGTATLRVQLWPDGTLVAGRLPDGGIWGQINPDGSISAKLGWWRGLNARLTISGRRLDEPAAELSAYVPDAYGERGFQPTVVTFPTLGCWEVTGSLRDAP